MRLVFMGTPDFAVAPLKALIAAGHTIAAVVTVPDKPAGRGQKLSVSAVKTFGVENNLPVLQPDKLKNPGFIAQLQSLNADAFIVVAFRMLPAAVFTIPRLGTINIHASLLPQYRGAAPINHVLINGETETGVTTFFINPQIDTGDILLQHKVAITDTDTAGTLHDKLMHSGAQLIVHTLAQLQQGTLQPSPQQLAGIEKPAPKIFKADCLINFNRPARQVYNFIRGLSPYPAAFTQLNGKQLKIYAAHTGPIPAGPQVRVLPSAAPAPVYTDGKSFIAFSCADGAVYADELQLEGKKRMPVADLLRGLNL